MQKNQLKVTSHFLNSLSTEWGNNLAALCILWAIMIDTHEWTVNFQISILILISLSLLRSSQCIVTILLSCLESVMSATKLLCCVISIGNCVWQKKERRHLPVSMSINKFSRDNLINWEFYFEVFCCFGGQICNNQNQFLNL